MRPCFLADENLNAKIITGLLRREPAIDFKTAKSADLLGSPDPEVLLVAARENRILVSHDRDTMAAHFSSFIETARSSGLIIVCRRSTSARRSNRSYLSGPLLKWMSGSTGSPICRCD